jgi:hypothetical protein
VFFSDEVWFSLLGEMNSQNNRYMSAENHRFIHELPLHDEIIGVWCAITARRIIVPIFYHSKVNAARYVNNIQSPFFELAEEERLYGDFQLHSATTHTAYVSLEALREVFGDRVISRGLCPPRSPDLVLCDFYW